MKDLLCYYVASLIWVLIGVMCLTIVLIPLWLCLHEFYSFWCTPLQWCYDHIY